MPTANDVPTGWRGPVLARAGADDELFGTRLGALSDDPECDGVVDFVGVSVGVLVGVFVFVGTAFVLVTVTFNPLFDWPPVQTMVTLTTSPGRT